MCYDLSAEREKSMLTRRVGTIARVDRGGVKDHGIMA